jgi:SAM-dependent methyltransferase
MPKMKSPQLRSFWDRIGRSLPPFINAPSTRYYFECERILWERYFPGLGKKKILKTDLWDEAKNTQILFWAAGRGAEIYGVDISPQIVLAARGYYAGDKNQPAHSGFIVSDLRYLATQEGSFDCLYSMGTIEHFPEYRQAIRECYRALKKGGTAIIGVPNRFDPFLRPLLVSFLNRLHLYHYGYEKSFGFRSLERELVSAGFQVIGRSGILFMPGFLRMLDLFVYVNWPQLSFLLKPLIIPFAFLYRKFPSLRKHGYLIASVVKKPN